jgi:uncharacterized membrane protein
VSKQTAETSEVDLPVTVAYHPWTRFASSPRLTDGVDEVAQESDTLTHWEISIGRVKREFDSGIIEQHRDERVARRSVEAVRVTTLKVKGDRKRFTQFIERRGSHAAVFADDPQSRSGGCAGRSGTWM